MRRPLLVLALVLSGAAGLGLEAVLLSAAGLALGYGRSTALGLVAWIAAWAVGAWLGGRLRWRSVTLFSLAGSASAAAAGVSMAAMLAAGRGAPGGVVATGIGLAAIAFAALPQGLFLPVAARAWSPGRGGARDVSWLFAASLIGSVAGAELVGFDAAAALGRSAAAWIAGSLALVAGLVAAAAVFRDPVEDPPDDSDAGSSPAPSRGLDPRAAAVVVAIGTAWLVGVEWTGVRLGALWLGGMQPALSAVLAASLLALAAGAGLVAPLLSRDARGVVQAIGLMLAGTLWPFFAHRALGDLDAHELVRALVLVGPALLPFGALLPAVHRAVAGESGRRLGGLLLHESWGAALGLPAIHFLLVPRFGLGGALVALSLLGALSALVVARSAPRLGPAVAAAGLVCAGLAATLDPPALASPQLSNPAFRVLAFTEDEDFAVTVVEDGVRGERTLLTDDFRATAVGDDYLYMRVLGHLPVLFHPKPQRVGVLAFGTGTTAGAVSLHDEVTRIDVLEISRAVASQAHWFTEANHDVFAEGLPGLLDDSDAHDRVVLHLGDGRRTLGALRGALDVLTMEPLLPDSPFAVYLYTREFYFRARASLAPGGIVCQWVPPHALSPETFEAVVGAFTSAFPWSGIFLFGTQVLLLGAEEAPLLDADRFPGEGTSAHAALAALGLETPDGVLARYVAGGAGWGAVDRPLTDADPWIVYRTRRSGRERATDLVRNLARLRRAEEDPPAAWIVAAGIGAWKRLEGVRLLHRAREAWHRWADVERFRVELDPDPTLDSLDSYRARLGKALGGDPELAQFDRLVRFDQSRTGGVAALAGGRPREALALLDRALELRPACGDLELFRALAAHELGDAGLARSAADRAFELCPRILATPQGRVALELGLPAPLARHSRAPGPAAGPGGAPD